MASRLKKEFAPDLIVFDMDGVLAHLDYAKRLATLSAYSGKSAVFIHDAIYGSDFERQAEAGAYATGKEYLAEYNRRLGIQLTREQWIAARKEAMTPIFATFEIARRLKRTFPLATLTNNGSLLKESIAQILSPAAELFGESFHASYEFGARKPEPLVFERIAERYGVEPSRVLFIDDTEEYIEGARSARLQTIHFASPDQLAGQLRELELF
jgi:FMN phosphatase YigB (HAD superfamily)